MMYVKKKDMKKNYFFIKTTVVYCVLALFFQTMYSQCPTVAPGSFFEFTSNQDIIDFVNTYPNCTDFPGNIRIVGANVTDISGLSQLESIASALEIVNTGLINLQGLENIQHSNLMLIISGNEHLQNFTGLENITGLQLVYFQQNPSLNSLSGLENVQSIQSLVLTENTILNDITALSNVTAIEGIDISYNESLTSLNGLEGIISAEVVTIGHNPILESLEGLENIIAVNGVFACNDNPLLSDISSLSNLTTVGEVGGGLDLRELPALENLDPLENLVNLTGVLYINYNDNLSSIDGLRNIAYEGITHLNITNNPLLEVCNISPVCNFLENSQNGGNTFIESNAPGCESIIEVENACLLSNGENILENFIVYPNPTETVLYLSQNTSSNIEIFDIAGKVVYKKKNVYANIDVSAFKSGMYIILINAEGYKTYRKFIKK